MPGQGLPQLRARARIESALESLSTAIIKLEDAYADFLEQT